MASAPPPLDKLDVACSILNRLEEDSSNNLGHADVDEMERQLSAIRALQAIKACLNRFWETSELYLMRRRRNVGASHVRSDKSEHLGWRADVLSLLEQCPWGAFVVRRWERYYALCEARAMVACASHDIARAELDQRWVSPAAKKDYQRALKAVTAAHLRHFVALREHHEARNRYRSINRRLFYRKGLVWCAARAVVVGLVRRARTDGSRDTALPPPGTT